MEILSCILVVYLENLFLSNLGEDYGFLCREFFRGKFSGEGEVSRDGFLFFLGLFRFLFFGVSLDNFSGL